MMAKFGTLEPSPIASSLAELQQLAEEEAQLFEKARQVSQKLRAEEEMPGRGGGLKWCIFG